MRRPIAEKRCESTSGRLDWGGPLRLVNLPGYSPDFNADEAIWGWAREEATGNLCLGTKAAVQSLPRRGPGGGPATS